jgi:surface polysaccharide O-acyltransferase-like enzyme
MKTLSLSQSVILVFFLIGYLLLTGYLRDQVVTQSAKLWISLSSTTILALSVVVSLYLKEKQLQMPDYKKYFYATFFIFLFILVAVILRK